MFWTSILLKAESFRTRFYGEKQLKTPLSGDTMLGTLLLFCKKLYQKHSHSEQTYIPFDTLKVHFVFELFSRPR